MDKPSDQHFPFEIKSLEPELAASLKEYYLADEHRDGFVRVGPKGYLMPHKYKQMAAEIYNMPLRTDDVFIVTYPRTGTTWTQELIWLLANDLDYARATATPLVQRFPFVEFSMLLNAEAEKDLIEKNSQNEENFKILEFLLSPGTEVVARLPSPRFIKTHLPMSLLPPALLDSTRVVYVARDPRDVAVSYYNLSRLFKAFNYQGDFKSYWNLFMKDMHSWSPFFAHLKEAWEVRHHPHMLFLFYEDLKKDLPAVVSRVAAFLGKQYSGEQTAALCDHLAINSFKDNKSVNDTVYRELGFLTDWQQSFIRKGGSGGWRAYFDAEMAQQAESWIQDNLRDTDLRFPHLETL